MTALRDIAFVRIIAGEEDVAKRAELDKQLLHRIAERSISIDMINVNAAGVFFVCDHENVENVREELRDLNLAVRIRPHCAKISIVGAGMRGTPGVMYRVVRSVSRRGRRNHSLDRLEYHHFGARAGGGRPAGGTGSSRCLPSRPEKCRRTHSELGERRCLDGS